MHPISAALFPVLALAVFLRSGWSAGRRLGAVFLLFSVSAATLVLILQGLGQGLGRFLDGFSRDAALPLVSDPGFREAYGLASIGHVVTTASVTFSPR